jgi:hypothetical protein
LAAFLISLIGNAPVSDADTHFCSSNGRQIPSSDTRRYFLVKDRFWRCTNPDLPEAEREALVKELMTARSLIKTAQRNRRG